MADLASAVFARLSGDAAVAAVVGTRIYPLIRPQDSQLPAIRIQYPSNTSERTLKGDEGSQTARVQLDCFASTFGAAWQLAVKAKAAMIAPATVAGVKFGGAEAEGPSSEGGEDTPQGYVHWVRLDLLMRHRLA